MSRFSPLLKRLQQLEPDPEYIESWPPDVEGSLSKVLYDQLREDGIELPAERPDKPFIFLYLKAAEWFWSREIVDGAT
jgi:hypothetical protein